MGLKDILENDKFILNGNIKISSTDAIFKMKSLMFYKRVKSRDYFDLLTLYEKGFIPKDTIELIQNYELAYQDRGIELFYLKLSQQVYKKEFDEPLTGLTKDVKSFLESLEQKGKESDEKFKAELKSTLKEIIDEVDAIMSLRTQTERHETVSYAGLKDYASDFCITEELIGDRNIIILHPGPIHRNIDITDGVLSDPRCKVLEQVKNGVAIRMAVIEKLVLNDS